MKFFLWQLSVTSNEKEQINQKLFMFEHQCTISQKVQKETMCQNFNMLTCKRTVQEASISISVIFNKAKHSNIT